MSNSYISSFQRVGTIVAYYRKRRGFSQQVLSEIIGEDISHIKNIELNGLRGMLCREETWSDRSIDQLIKIADTLKLRLVAFFLPASEENFKRYRLDK